MKVNIICMICLAAIVLSCKTDKNQEDSEAKEEVVKEKKILNDNDPDETLEESSREEKVTDRLRSKEEEYLEWSIEQGNLTINSSLEEIPMNFQAVGTSKLRRHIQYNERSFIEDVLLDYLFKSRDDSRLASRRLGVAKAEQIDTVLQRFFEISLSELNLIKILPSTETIYHTDYAKNLVDFKIPENILDHTNSGKSSDNFKTIVNLFKQRQLKKAPRFLTNAKTARDKFYNLNPSWYGSDSESGNTYVDSRKTYIYLPLGKLAFADRVVAHQLGMPEGDNTEGVLGEPNMSLEKFTIGDPRICNIGTKGILTIEFTNNALTDVNGPDLYVFEMGRIEPTNLEISTDGNNWLSVGKIEGGTAMVDISGTAKKGETYNYVRLTDLDTFSTVPGADVDAVAAIGGAIRLNLNSAVLFNTGKFQLKESASEELNKLVATIQEYSKGTIIVEGHTDNVGNPINNKILSENRAKEVRNYLKEHLSSHYTYQVKGYGENQPIAPNDTDENKQKNRRVEILVIPSK